MQSTGPKDNPYDTLIQFVGGGFGGCVASLCTHPVDLLKVRLQVQGSASGVSAPQLGLWKTTVAVFKEGGMVALYQGLSASLLRQATYTTTRFGCYMYLRELLADSKGNLPFYQKVLASMLAGAGGAVVGTPADVTLVRMQADGRLPPEKQRRYKHAVDGLVRIVREEGFFTMWKGCLPNVFRAMFMTAGQLASYDQAKMMLLATRFFKDDPITHFTASTIAGLIAAVITSPLDVVKSRVMNAEKGYYQGSLDCTLRTLRVEGPFAFYRGFVPYAVRLTPHTIITFLAFEQFNKACVWLLRKAGKLPPAATA
jgi:uncharacterized membrane protein YjjP (DUF1212 family)